VRLYDRDRGTPECFLLDVYREQFAAKPGFLIHFHTHIMGSRQGSGLKYVEAQVARVRAVVEISTCPVPEFSRD